MSSICRHRLGNDAFECSGFETTKKFGRSVLRHGGHWQQR